MNELLETRKLDVFKHSNFKLDQTPARWFVVKANLKSMKLEILEISGQNSKNSSLNSSLNSKNVQNLKLLCVQTGSSEAHWNSNLMKSELVQALVIIVEAVTAYWRPGLWLHQTYSLSEISFLLKDHMMQCCTAHPYVYQMM